MMGLLRRGLPSGPILAGFWLKTLEAADKATATLKRIRIVISCNQNRGKESSNKMFSEAMCNPRLTHLYLNQTFWVALQLQLLYYYYHAFLHAKLKEATISWKLQRLPILLQTVKKDVT
jgi:hypothetical protein